MKNAPSKVPQSNQIQIPRIIEEISDIRYLESFRNNPHELALQIQDIRTLLDFSLTGFTDKARAILNTSQGYNNMIKQTVVSLQNLQLKVSTLPQKSYPKMAFEVMKNTHPLELDNLEKDSDWKSIITEMQLKFLESKYLNLTWKECYNSTHRCIQLGKGTPIIIRVNLTKGTMRNQTQFLWNIKDVLYNDVKNKQLESYYTDRMKTLFRSSTNMPQNEDVFLFALSESTKFSNFIIFKKDFLKQLTQQKLISEKEEKIVEQFSGQREIIDRVPQDNQSTTDEITLIKQHAYGNFVPQFLGLLFVESTSQHLLLNDLFQKDDLISLGLRSLNSSKKQKSIKAEFISSIFQNETTPESKPQSSPLISLTIDNCQLMTTSVFKNTQKINVKIHSHSKDVECIELIGEIPESFTLNKTNFLLLTKQILALHVTIENLQNQHKSTVEWFSPKNSMLFMVQLSTANILLCSQISDPQGNRLSTLKKDECQKFIQKQSLYIFYQLEQWEQTSWLYIPYLNLGKNQNTLILCQNVLPGFLNGILRRFQNMNFSSLALHSKFLTELEQRHSDWDFKFQYLDLETENNCLIYILKSDELNRRQKVTASTVKNRGIEASSSQQKKNDINQLKIKLKISSDFKRCSFEYCTISSATSTISDMFFKPEWIKHLQKCSKENSTIKINQILKATYYICNHFVSEKYIIKRNPRESILKEMVSFSDQ